MQAVNLSWFGGTINKDEENNQIEAVIKNISTCYDALVMHIDTILIHYDELTMSCF